MPKRLGLKKGQEQEMLQLYQRGDATVAELAETYGVSSSWFYRMLQRHEVTPHRGVLTQETSVPEETEVPVHNNIQLAVTTDGQGIVQSAQPVRRSGNISTWEIRYTGTIFIDAVDIDEAIREARKMGVVKRIYYVRVKST
jgi:transposase-like protein